MSTIALPVLCTGELKMVQEHVFEICLKFNLLTRHSNPTGLEIGIANLFQESMYGVSCRQQVLSMLDRVQIHHLKGCKTQMFSPDNGNPG